MGKVADTKGTLLTSISFTRSFAFLVKTESMLVVVPFEDLDDEA